MQYFSRFYAWYLYRTNNPQSAIDPYDAAKKQVGLTRKILRVGKFVEHFKAAAVAADSTAVIDPLLKYLAVARQLGYAGYLALDSMTVVSVTSGPGVRADRADGCVTARRGGHQEVGCGEDGAARGHEVLARGARVQRARGRVLAAEASATEPRRRQEGGRGRRGEQEGRAVSTPCLCEE